MGGEHRLDLLLVGAREQHRAGAVGEQLADDPHALLGRLAGAVHRLRRALPERAVVVDEGIAEIGEGEPAQPGDGVVGRQFPGADGVDHRPQLGLVHLVIVAERPPVLTPRHT